MYTLRNIIEDNPQFQTQECFDIIVNNGTPVEVLIFLMDYIQYYYTQENLVLVCDLATSGDDMYEIIKRFTNPPVSIFKKFLDTKPYDMMLRGTMSNNPKFKKWYEKNKGKLS